VLAGAVSIGLGAAAEVVMTAVSASRTAAIEAGVEEMDASPVAWRGSVLSVLSALSAFRVFSSPIVVVVGFDGASTSPGEGEGSRDFWVVVSDG
jgi:hypothetical protein